MLKGTSAGQSKQSHEQHLQAMVFCRTYIHQRKHWIRGRRAANPPGNFILSFRSKSFLAHHPENLWFNTKIKRLLKKTFSPHQSAPITATMKWQFKEENALNNRQAESAKIRSKYPERIPVIVEKVPNTTIPDIDKKKFLVPNDISVAQFMWIIRKRIQLPSERAIFLFVGKILPQSSASMGQIYQEHRDEDGFLYIAYSGENSFGASLVETS